LILVVDFDGTWIHGSLPTRQRAYERIANRPHAALVYLTHRYIDSARAVQQLGRIPQPDVWVADRGSAVAVGDNAPPPPAVDQELDRRWPGAEPIRERLAPLSAVLDELPGMRQRRLSFAAHDETPCGEVMHEMATLLDDVGVDIVQGRDETVDVLPGGVTPAFTVERVLYWLDAEPEWVTVAASSLRYIGLFRSGRRGIIVPDSEFGLRMRLRARPDVYTAQQGGAAGVLEGLEHFGYFDAPPGPARSGSAGVS
jgi:mannosylfructose-6-phosphate phosphatase